MFIINTYSLMVFNSPSLGLTSLSHFGLMGNFPEHFPAQGTLQQPPSQASILCHVLLPLATVGWVKGSHLIQSWVNQGLFFYKFGIGREKAKISKLPSSESWRYKSK